MRAGFLAVGVMGFLLAAGCSNSPTPATGRVPQNTVDGEGYSELPNMQLTPGAVRATDLASVEATEAETEAGRPTWDVKRQVYAEYGITPGRGLRFEIDHLQDIATGGSNDIGNLWPEPRFDVWNAYDKDKLEMYLFHATRAGEESIPDAQAELVPDWRVSYIKHFGKPAGYPDP
jgi:hypothetical protein